MKFKTRILLLPAVTLALFVASWIASNAVTTHTSNAVKLLGTVDYPYLEGLKNFDVLFKRTTQTVQSAVAEGDQSKLADVQQIATDANTTIKKLAVLDGHQSSASKLGTAYQAYVSAATAAAKSMLDPKAAAGGNALTDMQNTQKSLETLLNGELAAASSSVQNRLATSSQGLHRVMLANTASAVIIIAVLLLGAALLLRAITRELGAEPEQLRKVMGRIASGDLQSDKNDRKAHESSVLGQLQAMAAKLTEIVSSIRRVSEEVGDASKQIAAGNDDLSTRTQNQAASLEETSSSMEEMTATVQQNADNADKADQLARDARGKAEQGGQVMNDAIDAMHEIHTSSRRIADIVALIDEIAFQTNLLALNAAVEAARAGEQGRGFAVVATEVRNLAQRSAGAAKEIKTLINDSVQKVKSGGELVERSGKTLGEIVDGVKKVTDIVAEIAAASREQASGIDQVSRAVSSMDEDTQQNAALVEQAAASSRAMQEQAGMLVREVSFFRMGETSEASDEAFEEPSSTKMLPAPAVAKSKPAKALPAAPACATAGADVWQEF
ncbi:MAG TPA: methyl-accepting chemotaxis protein [Rhodanobacter sp.]|nr:methyl-accepting chemotaxis protein [Rhodanobacter sp.]